MARVVLGPRRLAGRPVEPVVERAEADQEPQRRDQQREQQDPVLGLRDDLAVGEDREAVRLADADDDRGAENHAEDEEGEPRAGYPVASVRRPSQPPFVTSERYFTSASIWAGWSVCAEVRRHDVRLVTIGDHRVRIVDRLLDERLVLAFEHLVEVRPDGAGRARVRERVAGRAVRRRRREERLSRPTARGRCRRRPRARGVRRACARGRRKSFWLTTCTVARITACPRPQSSAQTIG